MHGSLLYSAFQIDRNYTKDCSKSDDKLKNFRQTNANFLYQLAYCSRHADIRTCLSKQVPITNLDCRLYVAWLGVIKLRRELLVTNVEVNMSISLE